MAKETLRSLTSKVPEPDEADRIMSGLHQESDRTAAIVGSSLVESTLQDLIGSAMSNKAIDLPEKLFENRGPLSDFNSKIIIAQAFGLISDRMASDLQRIRKIRNCFAHARVNVDFENSLVAREVSELAVVIAVRATEARYTPDHPFPYNSHKTSYGLFCYITMIILKHQIKHGKRADGQPFAGAPTPPVASQPSDAE